MRGVAAIIESAISDSKTLFRVHYYTCCQHLICLRKCVCFNLKPNGGDLNQRGLSLTPHFVF